MIERKKSYPRIARLTRFLVLLSSPIILLQIALFYISFRSRQKTEIECDPFTNHYHFLKDVEPPLRFFIYNFTDSKFKDLQIYTQRKKVNKVEYYFEPYLLSYIKNNCILTNNPNETDLFYIPIYFSMTMFTDGRFPIESLLGRLDYYSKNGGLDHLIVFNIFAFWRATIQEKYEHILPCMMSFADVNWDLSIRYPLLMPRFTLLPYSSLNKLSIHRNFNRNALLFYIGSTLLSTFNEFSCEMRTEILEYASKLNFSQIFVKERGKNPDDLTNGFAIERMMHESQFCLVPLGDSPSSKRIYDSFNALCIPIIISDYIRFPFENIFINYSKILLQISMKNYQNDLPLILSASNTKIIEKMQNSINTINKFFYLKEKNIKPNSIFWAWAVNHYIKLSFISSSMRRDSLIKCSFLELDEK
ncbi:Exostosin family protein [Tritrichomonas foetus]|uniref:Exostosin family protein n=1 Tax=Tritrichomonas foetus TaxID=1144522 RepID=A0A1J4L0Q9_9EUKA|nr:Exostosin family protein [Tritrichomonas foetus]|eukprot:OHT15558.1 Exostosin family protein [Tritrichomonas foetus]